MIPERANCISGTSQLHNSLLWSRLYKKKQLPFEHSSSRLSQGHFLWTKCPSRKCYTRRCSIFFKWIWFTCVMKSGLIDTRPKRQIGKGTSNGKKYLIGNRKKKTNGKTFSLLWFHRLLGQPLELPRPRTCEIMIGSLYLTSNIFAQPVPSTNWTLSTEASYFSEGNQSSD